MDELLDSLRSAFFTTEACKFRPLFRISAIFVSAYDNMWFLLTAPYLLQSPFYVKADMVNSFQSIGTAFSFIYVVN